MKTHQTTHPTSIRKVVPVALTTMIAVLAWATVAEGQSLGIYYNLQSYGTVSAGGLVLDALGNTTATLNNDPNTSLTSSGLTTVAAAGNSATAGLALPGSAFSGYTGSFTIQDWFTVNSGGGVTLFGANNGPENTWCGDGNTISTIIGGVAFGTLVSGGYSGTPAYSRWGQTFGGSIVPGAYDYVLTYTVDPATGGTGGTFIEYLNNSVVGSLYVTTFGSLAQATSLYNGTSGLLVGGALNEPWAPWGDAAANATTIDFLVYSGALSAAQVSALDAAGAGAATSTIIAIVPEPGTMTLSALGIGCLLVLGRWIAGARTSSRAGNSNRA